MTNRILVFLNCDTGNMEAFVDMEAFTVRYPSLDVSQRNQNGDVIVHRPGGERSFGKTLGYIQNLEVNK